jgi:CDP-glycerol glycerophosphotransferase (TagB/SpsB family)
MRGGKGVDFHQSPAPNESPALVAPAWRVRQKRAYCTSLNPNQ